MVPTLYCQMKHMALYSSNMAPTKQDGQEKKSPGAQKMEILPSLPSMYLESLNRITDWITCISHFSYYLVLVRNPTRTLACSMSIVTHQ